MSDPVHIGLGSNLGDREAALLQAVDALRSIDGVAVLAASSLYDSAPLGPDQPRFLNAVVAVECDLPPARLLTILQRIEDEAGRRRDVRWGPRTLDLDILLWGRQIVAEPNLQVPHLGLHKRRFALQPLLELTPDAHHPVLRQPLRDLFAAVEPQDVLPHFSDGWPLLVAPSPQS